jgi:hypothetical protein
MRAACEAGSANGGSQSLRNSANQFHFVQAMTAGSYTKKSSGRTGKLCGVRRHPTLGRHVETQQPATFNL